MTEREQMIRRHVTRFAVMLRYEVDELEMQTYLAALGEAPLDVIAEAADALLVEQAGLPREKRFPPTVADWIAICDRVIRVRRHKRAQEAAAMHGECEDCHGSGWKQVEGLNRVTRCDCVKRAMLHMDTAPKQLTETPPDEEVPF